MLKSFAYGLMFLILAGSIGVPVYQHTCLHEKKTINTLFVASNHCEQEHVQVEVPKCCAKAIKQTTPKESVEDNCCINEVDHWHFSCFSDGKIPMPQLGVYLAELFQFPTIRASQSPVATQISATNFGNDPPPIKINDRLALLCVWRI